MDGDIAVCRPNSTEEAQSYFGYAHVDTPNLGPWIVYAVSFALHLTATMAFNDRISISILRHCSLRRVKDSAKNAWTNIGVTTSLVLTTVIGALIEGHEITPQGYCIGEYQMFQIRQIYVALCLTCFFANINCILFCVLTLFHWDSLTDADAIEFLRHNPQILGETVIYMMESYLFFVLAIAAWLYGTYGRPIVFGIFLALAGSALANTARVWWNLASFDPKAPRRPSRRWGRTGQRWQHVLDQVSEHERLELKPGEDSILEGAPARSSNRDDSESDVSHEATNRATTDGSTRAVQQTISRGSSEEHVRC
ncbi:unnamed protein product [Symbiodinium sp. CCMP2456]|nr:unnamed protein product [Symbiodinium sp. CCMP2456]